MINNNEYFYGPFFTKIQPPHMTEFSFRIRTFAAIIFLSLALTSQAQMGLSIKGVLADSVTRKPIEGASIAFLTLKDSTVVELGVTDVQGYFEMSQIKPGDYLFSISHISYKIKERKVILAPMRRMIDMDTIFLSKSDGFALNEVEVVREKIPMIVKEDTLEFNASSFKVKEDAMVEDLVKKLPGVEVDKDGGVTAQGQKVSKVMVDGKQFFGNDPKIAMKNLPANVVDKVQIIDQKSDQANFTKIDDGETEKTMNLTIKKDKKKGTFGIASVGYGNHDRYEANLTLNRFDKTRQISVIGNLNNTNKQSFTLNDLRDFSGMSGGAMRTMGSAMMGMMGGGGGGGMGALMRNMDVLGLGNNQNGLSKTAAGGLNYRDSWGKKVEVSGSYFINKVNSYTLKNITRDNLLPDSSFLTLQDNEINADRLNHRLNFRLEWRPDTLNEIMISPTLSYTHALNDNDTKAVSKTNQETLINNTLRNNNSDQTNPSISGNILWNRRLNKVGRTVSINLSGSTDVNEANTYTKSLISYYIPVIIEDTLDQLSYYNEKTKALGGRIAYTEPVTKDNFIELNYSLNNNYSKSVKDVNELDVATNQYSLLNTRLSDTYDNNYMTNQLGLNYSINKKKYTLTFGAAAQKADLTGKSFTRDSSYKQSTINYYPNLNFNYTFSKNKRIRVNYRGRMKQPSLSQLQPITDNSDPLNLRIGNPNLLPEFSNNVNINFNQFDVMTFRSLFANIGFSKTENKITNSLRIDPNNGRRISQYINADGAYTANGAFSFGFPLGSITRSINSTSMVNWNRDQTYTNELENISNTLNLTQTIRINYSKDEKFDLGASGSINYYDSKYSLQPDLAVKYYTYITGFEGTVYLPWKLQLGFDWDYYINTGRTDGFNQKYSLLVANISKSFLKNNAASIKFEFFDILNQNSALNRTTTETYIEDSRINVIQPYFLLSFAYRFNKMDASVGGRGEGRGGMMGPGGMPPIRMGGF